MEEQKLLQVDDLRVEFRTDEGIVRAVNGVSFDLAAGETLGIVGESGSGKSVTNLAMLGLIPQPPGRISSGTALYRGEDLLTANAKRLSQIRGRHIAMIFQDPMTALNPFLTVEEQLTEVTRLHLGHSHDEAIAHAIKMLEQVGITGAEKRVFDYPHQFSGGMRQRVMIAMALSCNPDILIADEPSTALDVTIQAQILDLMKQLQKDHGTAIIMITHDLGVVANICHRVLVMYGGKIVERADVDSLFANPRHPYTLGLLESVPRWDADLSKKLKVVPGQPPDLAHLPAGCSFYPRCSYREVRCEQSVPPAFERPEGGDFACFIDVDSVKPVEERT
ncbi:MAG: ABC transporter ATP-binding protein [Planctomycetaceae bacterium]|nr:ABC transporter ATP-binding protein [Planctomycetaceae bacterium]